MSLISYEVSYNRKRAQFHSCGMSEFLLISFNKAQRRENALLEVWFLQGVPKKFPLNSVSLMRTGWQVDG